MVDECLDAFGAAEVHQHIEVGELDFVQGKLLEDYVECSRSLLAQNERNACELFQRDFVGD